MSIPPPSAFVSDSHACLPPAGLLHHACLALPAHTTPTNTPADGDRVTHGDVFGEVAGDAASILVGERVALNFMQRMSGIATATAALVAAVAGTSAKWVGGGGGAGVDCSAWCGWRLSELVQSRWLLWFGCCWCCVLPPVHVLRLNQHWTCAACPGLAPPNLPTQADNVCASAHSVCRPPSSSTPPLPLLHHHLLPWQDPRDAQDRPRAAPAGQVGRGTGGWGQPPHGAV